MNGDKMDYSYALSTLTDPRGFDRGEPLPAGLRERLERGLDADLSAVRVHTGPRADRLARALGADAFASGAQVHFRAGAYRPDTAPGLRLLAHEVAHLVQQARGPVGGDRYGSWTIGRAGDRWEWEADRYAARVLANRGSGPARDRAVVEPTVSWTVQCHSSYEHRLLGDLEPDNLVDVTTNGPHRREILTKQIRLLELWKEHPLEVTSGQVETLCPWIMTFPVGPENLLVTYGELNALPDYLPDGETFESVSPDVLLPILQLIRQDGYNELKELLDGSNPNQRFEGAACRPVRLTNIGKLMETSALDALTMGLGAQGRDHYQGLLARNACHFAPFSWYRWQTTHLIAREFARRAHSSQDRGTELRSKAWRFHGYADHFLQDSFAAGHLVNKTLVMQWFIEWAAEQDWLPISDWDSVKEMTTSRQPNLGGKWLYDSAFPGPSNDPQVAQEAATLVGRVLASGVVPDGNTDQFVAYQQYLMFLSNAAVQLASAFLHDHFNATSLWVASEKQTDPYLVWGDYTLLTEDNGGDGVRATSDTSLLSRKALLEIIANGETSISVAEIRGHFPTRAGATSSNVQDLETWSLGLKEFCRREFGKVGNRIKEMLSQRTSPRLGVVSQDEDLASVWSRSLPGCGYGVVDTLWYDGRLFAGSNGWIYELDATSGRVTRQLQVTSSVVDVTDTRLATDGTTLFVGAKGSAYGVLLSDWSKQKWSTPGVGQHAVSVLYSGGALYAGSNAHVYQLDPGSGVIRHDLPLPQPASGDTALATDGTTLFAGVYGKVYGIAPTNWTNAQWTTPVGNTPAGQPVSVLSSGGALYAGSNGWVYQLDPGAGTVLNGLQLGGARPYLATDATTLYVGVHGATYAVALDDWSTYRWKTKVGGAGSFPTHVLTTGDQLFAGTNGYVYDLDPGTGQIEHSLLLTYRVGDPGGDYTTSLATDGPHMFAGVHGYADKVLAQHRALDGSLYHDWRDSTGTWHGWTDNFDSAPSGVQAVTASMGTSGNLEAFAIDSAGLLSHAWQNTGGTWQPWSSGFGPADGVRQVTAALQPPLVVFIRLPVLQVLAIGGDGTLWQTCQTGNGAWQGWTQNLDNAPQPLQWVYAALGPTKNVEVFVIGFDGTLYHNYFDQNSAWHGWSAHFDSAPGPMRSVYAVMGPTNLETFALGMDGTLYHNWLDTSGHWHGWQGDFNGAPQPMQSVAAAMGPANLEVFAIGVDGTLYHNWLDTDGWHGWQGNFWGAPGPMQSVFTAHGADGGLEVFATGIDGTMYHNALNGDWGDWTPNVDSAPNPVLRGYATVGASNNLEVFAISDAGSAGRSR